MLIKHIMPWKCDSSTMWLQHNTSVFTLWIIHRQYPVHLNTISLLQTATNTTVWGGVGGGRGCIPSCPNQSKV